MERMQEIERSGSIQELVDAYVQVHNQFWIIEDDVYDYTEGTEDYVDACKKVEVWYRFMKLLENRVLELAKREGFFLERQKDLGIMKQLEAFMKKYGYQNSDGWWVNRDS